MVWIILIKIKKNIIEKKKILEVIEIMIEDMYKNKVCLVI